MRIRHMTFSSHRLFTRSGFLLCPPEGEVSPEAEEPVPPRRARLAKGGRVRGVL